jgi:hypothetical protein
MGLNEASAATEAGALAARGIGVDRIVGEAATSIDLGGHSYDLSTATGTTLFAAAVARAYRLDYNQAAAISEVLTNATASGRDELARLVLRWAPAEIGATIASRLVLSGHSSAGVLWGHSSIVAYEAVRSVARALPSAARQIEDVHVSGCFTEHEVQDVAEWILAFPNLRTLWAYRSFAPAAPVGHLVDWELATRGRTSRLDESLARSHAPATAWSLTGGIVGSGLTLDERRARVVQADARLSSYLSGDRAIAHAHQTDAEVDYGAYQMLAAHHDATPEERAAASLHAGQMLRARFYEQSVRGEFAARHGALIASALQRLGLPPADFAALSRKEALQVTESVRDRAPSSRDRDVTRARALLSGLAALRPDVIPEGWCH